MAPFALAPYVVTVRGDRCGAPGFVLCQVSLVPGACPVDHSVELEGEYAGEVGRGSTDGRAHSRLWRLFVRGCKKKNGPQ